MRCGSAGLAARLAPAATVPRRAAPALVRPKTSNAPQATKLLTIEIKVLLDHEGGHLLGGPRKQQWGASQAGEAPPSALPYQNCLQCTLAASLMHPLNTACKACTAPTHLLHAVLVQLHACRELEVAAAAQAAGVGPGEGALRQGGWGGGSEALLGGGSGLAQPGNTRG